MSNFSKEDRIKIFTSLFRGRTDVFARRWEKWDGSVSGYSPVYKNWAKKEHAPLTDFFIEKHLLGQMVLGLYPLLPDNTSYFIAVDFDDEKWLNSAKRLFRYCKKYGLPVYVERSRSGNGSHVWCFFDDNYPAYKSRQIFFYLLRKSKNIDDLDKEDSFDRLFPNQDYLSGKGLGNIVYEIPSNYKEKSVRKKKLSPLEVIVRDTNFSLPFSPKRTDFQSVLKILTFDSDRNRLMAEDVAIEARQNNRCLILTERKEHVDILNFYLKRDFEVVTLTGDMTPKKRKQQEKNVEDGNFQILIATGQLLGEGSDIHNLDCLFLVFPFSFEGKLIQYIGRIQRGEGAAKKVYDYRDSQIEMLEKLFKKRQRYYNKLSA